MKQGYAIKQVKDICAKGSSQVAQKDLEGITGDYPIFGASGLIKNVDFYHQEKEYIGLVKDGSGIGRAMFLPPKSSVIGTLQYILPKDGYNIRYIGYCLQSLRLDKYKQGAAIPHIYFKDYGEAQILVAENSDEQQRIVSLLDAEFAKIDTLKANAERSLLNAKDLLSKSIKKTLSGYHQVCLKDLFDIRTGKLNSNEAVVGGQYPFFTCSREVFAIDKYAFDCEAVLLAGNNASGDFNVKYYKGKFNAYQRTYVITAKTPQTNTRILYYVLTDFLSELKKMSLGANTKFLKLGMIENIKVPIVDAQEIISTINRLDALNEKCKTLQANYEKTIALCDDLKQALLRKAFNGEI